MNMPLKVKIIYISIYYFMYKQLYNVALNLDVAFLLSVSIVRYFRIITINTRGFIKH